MLKIAILTSSQHAIPHGGIGQFTKRITELLRSNGHEVHILLDKKPRKDFLFNVADNLWYPSKPLPTIPSEDRHKQGIDYAKIENFKNIIESMNDFNYDLYLVNTPEAFDSITQANVTGKVILYTHNFNQIYPELKVKSVFTDEYRDHFNSFMKQHIVATQSVHNQQQLIKNGVKQCLVMPMPLTEIDLLSSSQHVEKSGVLFIGTHSPGKNPSAYINVMKKLGLPCKVMTSPKSARTFEKKFKENGIKDYDIRVGITGSEKVDFIKSCKVSFNCSLLENYPFAFLECVGHMPVVVLDRQNWTDNFDNRFYHKVSSRTAHKKITELYNSSYNDDALEYVKDLDNQARTAWSKI